MITLPKTVSPKTVSERLDLSFGIFARRGEKYSCYTTAQAQNRHDILNIGGFSDQVFTLIGSFAEQGMGADFWVEEIEKTELAAVN